ncbi:Putative DNA-invertase from lambdoid prophage Rac [uncultured Clostridium sp.]|nr:Putative DNA-invertase from lambdoid prophage Rac [uncultured Clostridium sp.]
MQYLKELYLVSKVMYIQIVPKLLTNTIKIDKILVSKITVVKFNTKISGGTNNMKILGYCRISTNKQSIERQHRNILELYPSAIIVDEVYTGTKVEGRKEWNKLLKQVKQGDTIVFDSVSRMSRNAEEGFSLYEELFNNGIELVFIKEPHINTTTYKEALTNNIQMTGTAVDSILKGINEYLLALAKEQIKLAFIQSEKEVRDLQQRTKEGIETARLNGKQIGQVKGSKLTTKKSLEAKETILKHSKDFKGTLSDIDVIKLCGISRNSYYKYKKELIEELNETRQ